MDIIEKIMDYAKKNAAIDAVILNGSRANPLAQCDKYSDYDVAFVVQHVAEQMQNYDDFCAMFGKVLIMQQPDKNRISFDDTCSQLKRYAFLTVFEQGLRIDLTYVQAADAVCYMHGQAYNRILLNKRANLNQTEDEVVPKADCNRDNWSTMKSEVVPKADCNRDQFFDSCNEFWWVLPYVYKGILRQNLPYAARHVDDCLAKECFKMIAWYQQTLPPNGTCQCWQDQSDILSMCKSLKCLFGKQLTGDFVTKQVQKLTRLFCHYARKVAEKLHLDYDSVEEQNCYRYLSIMEDRAIVLETPRLRLRKLCDTDMDNLSAILMDVRVMYAYEHAFCTAEVREWLNRMLDWYYNYGIGLWAVELKQTHVMIGQAGLTYQDTPKGRVLEIGYLFCKEYWHQGYATESALAVKEFAFQNMHADEVCCIIRDNNLPSQAVAQRIGMGKTVEFVKHYYEKDMPHWVFSASKSAAR